MAKGLQRACKGGVIGQGSRVMESAVEIEELTKDFRLPFGRGRFRAVDNLSLRVAPGEVYGLLGPNGSGKSTTMKMLLGLVKPTSGRCFLFGESSRVVRSREGVGFLPENPYFYKHLTGRETLRFYGRLCGLRGAALEERVGELLSLTGLENAADRALGGYSKGMLQRIGLGQALVHDPRLLVLDEPTAGVDPAGSRKLRDLIHELRQRGKTIILCSHLLEQVQEVCDHVGILSAGRMVREGVLDDLIAIDNQVEYVVEDAPEGMEAEVGRLAEAGGGRLVRSGHPRTTLERLYLETTSASQEKGGDA